MKLRTMHKRKRRKMNRQIALEKFGRFFIEQHGKELMKRVMDEAARRICSSLQCILLGEATLTKDGKDFIIKRERPTWNNISFPQTDDEKVAALRAMVDFDSYNELEDSIIYESV